MPGEIRALIENQQEREAVKELEAIDIQKLTRAELEEADALFAALPHETLCSSVDLCYGMILIKGHKGDLTAAVKWNGTLTGMREGFKGSDRAVLENRISCASLYLPEIRNPNFLLNLAVLSNEFSNAKFPLARLSATAKFPSVLRGAMDFSGLGKHYQACASMVRPLLPAILEDNANGACETAIAEVLYERNDLNGASLQVAGAITAGNPEIAFAALSLLARLGAVDASAKPPSEILSHIGGMLEKKQAGWLEENYLALRARFDMLNGDTEKVREWMGQCPLNDYDSGIPQNAYGLITKAKAYIALGEYRNSATLLESLTLAMEKENRTLDAIECLINCAIACDFLGSGDLALGKLEHALLLAQEYSYIRVFSDCGKPLLSLISRYMKDSPHEKLGEAYLKKIAESAKIFATLHPSLYASKDCKGGEEGEELTQSEVQILHLLSDGKTNKVIAKELSVQPTTVSFHLTNLFEKLGASNRTEAVKVARDRGIL